MACNLPNAVVYKQRGWLRAMLHESAAPACHHGQLVDGTESKVQGKSSIPGHLCCPEAAEAKFLWEPMWACRLFSAHSERPSPSQRACGSASIDAGAVLMYEEKQIIMARIPRTAKRAHLRAWHAIHTNMW